MSLENFRIPETPESRTHRVVLLLIAICLVSALVRGGWRFLVGLSYGAELLAMAAAAAVLYAIVRYARQRSA
jgi:hypothetical protein